MYGTPKVTKEYILSKISQIDIFEYYLNINVRFGQLFCSPLRKDSHPTCSFKWVGGYLYFRDWSENKPKNCFQIVMEIKGCNFYEALEFINMELSNKVIPYSVSPDKVIYEKQQIKNKSNKKIIDIKINKYYQKEIISYFKSYKLTNKQMKKFNIFPISKVWLDNKLFYSYNNNDPAVAYYFGTDEKGNKRWKIYFFKRNNYRFIGNTNRINGWIQLPESGKLLVITKSLKDVACLDLFNIPAISMQNETTIPYDYIIEELKQRFTTIVSLYDFDRTGVINANKLKKLYSIPYLFFKNIPNVKDFSDYVKYYGIKETKTLILKTNERIFSKDI
jgi:hypothetical protein